MSELKQCPFCGGSGSLWHRPSKYGELIFIQCDLCGAQTKPVTLDKYPLEDAKTIIITRWNVRVGD